jgi:hypothetical protein
MSRPRRTMSAEGLNDQRIKESPLTRNQSQNSIDENEHNYKEGSIARSEELEDLHSAVRNFFISNMR